MYMYVLYHLCKMYHVCRKLYVVIVLLEKLLNVYIKPACLNSYVMTLLN